MPTKAVSAETMEIGKKGGGKHWTAAEKAAREVAAEEMRRAEPLALIAPDWLNREALSVWDQAIELAKGVNLFDKLDTETLATYCDAVVQYRRHSVKKRRTVEDIKLQQAWARIIAQYADKLGFTPAARARLIKKRAEEKLDQFGKKFD